MSIYIKKIITCFALSSFIFLSPLLTANAQNGTNQGSLLEGQEGMTEVQTVFGSQTDVRVSVIKIIDIILGLLGVIFLALIVFAGFKYMTAAGNEDQVKQAIKQITQAVIGLVIVLASWGISYFIITRIMGVSQ